MANIVVLGSLNMDFVARTPHIPVPGETVLGHDLTFVPGGKGANQAYTLGRLGADVSMLGCVGADPYGEQLLDNLQAVNVDTRHVERLTNHSSGIAVIEVGDDGDNNIVVLQGANLQVTSTYLQKHLEAIKAADALVMQLEIPVPTVLQAAKIAKDLGKLVILDPAPAAPLPEELWPHVDVVKPNETELALLTSMPVKNLKQAEAAARTLLAKGVKQVVVSMGGAGALMVEEGKAVHIPALPVKAVDSTAAGDGFTAAMTLKLVAGESLEDALGYAVAVAALVVTRSGAQSSIPTQEEVAAFMRQQCGGV